MTDGYQGPRLTRKQIAWRAAQDIAHGSYVNLGIGMPVMASQFVPEGHEVVYHSENGILGFGPMAEPGEEDFDLVNAAKVPVTLLPGASFVHHADSFAMIRGGHLDIALLGAFQVAQNGDLANWRIGNKGVPAVGGAMDLVTGAKEVYVLTEHVTKDGTPKLLERCEHPLTGVGVVTRIFTDLAVIHIKDGRFVLKEIVDGLDVDALQSMTGAKLHTDGDVHPIPAPELA